MIVECNVWCSMTQHLELGIESNYWLPFAVDFMYVIAVKQNMADDAPEEEFVPFQKAVIYTASDQFVTDMDYQHALSEFKKTRHKNYGK